MGYQAMVLCMSDAQLLKRTEINSERYACKCWIRGQMTQRDAMTHIIFNIFGCYE